MTTTKERYKITYSVLQKNDCLYQAAPFFTYATDKAEARKILNKHEYKNKNWLRQVVCELLPRKQEEVSATTQLCMF